MALLRFTEIKWQAILRLASSTTSIVLTFQFWNSEYISLIAVGGLITTSFSYKSLPKPPRRREWLFQKERQKLSKEQASFALQQGEIIQERERFNKSIQELNKEKASLGDYKAVLWANLQQQAQKYIADNLNPRLASIAEREEAIATLIEEKGKSWQLQVNQLVQREGELIEANKKLADECNQKLDVANNLVKTAESRAEQYYRQLYGSVTAKHVQELVRPDYISPPGSKEEFQANDVIRCLKDYGIVVKKPVVKQLSQGFEIQFEVLPKLLLDGGASGDKEQERLITTGEALEFIKSRCLTDLMSKITGCANKPEVLPIYNGIKMIIDTTGMIYQATEPKSLIKIDEPPAGNIFKIFLKSYHLGFAGSTGRGKTTWTRNCLGAMCQELGSENVQIKVSAGKPDEALREFGAVVGVRNGILLLKEAADLVTARLTIHENDYMAGRPLTIWDKKYIYFFDEITDLARHWNGVTDPEDIDFLVENNFPVDRKGNPIKNIVGALLKRIWILGRSLGIMNLIAGQNLNASTLGVQLADLQNMGMIYLGTASRVGIGARGLPTSSEQAYLNNQYALRIKDGQEFFGLFCDATGDAWFSKLPAPGEYSMSPETELSYETTSPYLLVQSKLNQIKEAIASGIVKPAQIAVEIWGDKVNLQAAPYNSKNGLKVLLQKIIELEGVSSDIQAD